MFNLIDEKLKAIEFNKIEESEDIVVYERQMTEYVQVLEIGHRDDGKHMIQSYQKGVNSDGCNNVVGLTMHETQLAMRKIWQKGW